MKKFLIVVDIQKDFVDGSLGTKEAQSIIENAATKIRDNKRNINQYFFGFWIYINRLLMPSQIKFTSICAHKIKQNSFDNQVICLNDDNVVKDDDYKILWEGITQNLLLKLNE